MKAIIGLSYICSRVFGVLLQFGETELQCLAFPIIVEDFIFRLFLEFIVLIYGASNFLQLALLKSNFGNSDFRDFVSTFFKLHMVKILLRNHFFFEFKMQIF